MSEQKNTLPNGTNIRLDDETKARLNKVANKHGIKKTDLIRNAVYAKLPEWEIHGVRLVSR